MSDKPVAAGKSSFDLIDREKTFAILDVQSGSVFVDLACGVGNYSIEVAKNIGDKGGVLAVDLWPEGLEVLNRKISVENIKNIKTLLADISKPLPFEENSIDSCLMATIVHDLSKSDQKSLVKEAARLLKPGGMLNIIEFQKIDKGPGPPVNIRMEEEEIELLVIPFGFEKVAGGAVGEFNYMLKYKKTA